MLKAAEHRMATTLSLIGAEEQRHADGGRHTLTLL